MTERVEVLSRRIGLYGRYLTEEIDADLAQQYLTDIKFAKVELAEIKRAEVEEIIRKNDQIDSSNLDNV